MSPPPSRSDALSWFISPLAGAQRAGGLLLLRSVAGGAAAIQGTLYLKHAAEPAVATWLLAAIAIVGGVGLVAGFLTLAAAAAVCVSTAVVTLSPGSTAGGTAGEHVAAALLIADAATIALLGPGAYSLDARVFGRREIIISHDRPHR
jgi:uncharacterized membrane protein YphA (DoxX/SURF4 family)